MTKPSEHENQNFSTFRILLLFAAILSNVTIGSHKLHSFKKSSHFHKSCIENYGGIWMGQELWLTEKQISGLSSLGTQFIGRSGMEEAISSGILRGRPFGGISMAWAPNLNHVIRPLTNYKYHRVVCVELNAEPAPIILISIYMPYFNSSKKQESIVETIDAISMMQSIIEDHPNQNS